MIGIRQDDMFISVDASHDEIETKFEALSDKILAQVLKL